MKRGHSHIYVDGIKPWPNAPHRAMVPISGGAYVYTVKELPPLSLSRCEWEMIGEAMGWKRKEKRKEV